MNVSIGHNTTASALGDRKNSAMQQLESWRNAKIPVFLANSRGNNNKDRRHSGSIMQGLKMKQRILSNVEAKSLHHPPSGNSKCWSVGSILSCVCLAPPQARADGRREAYSKGNSGTQSAFS